MNAGRTPASAPDAIATPPGGTFALGGGAVARIGFGAMQLTGPGPRTAPDRRAAAAILRLVRRSSSRQSD
jgi:hypothetical protein